MASPTFPRTSRLLRPGDFARLRDPGGRRVSTPHLSAALIDNTHATARLGLAISKRVSKSAVRRNRIKRIARESFRHVLPTLPCVDVLVIARSSADQQDNDVLRADFARLWRRLSTLNAAGPTGTMRD